MKIIFSAIHCYSASTAFFLLFLLVLSFFFDVSDAQGSYFSCSSSAQNYTANSIFEKNLRQLLSVLQTNASVTGFYNANVGQSPDQVYGLVQCNRDVSADECNTCAQSAATQILQDCPNKKIAVEWFDSCILRYSMVDFYGAVDNNKLALVNTVTMPNLAQFKPAVASFLNNLSVSAANSTLLYAAGSSPYTENTTLYGLTLCTRDLTRSSCSSCLKATVTAISQCCTDRQGARVLSASCVVRYEIYPFANITTPAPLPTSPAPAPHLTSPAPPPAPRTDQSSPPKKNGKVVVIAVAITVPGLLLLCILLVCMIGRKKKPPENLPQDGDDMPGFQSLIFDLSVVKTATNNFAESNKLGEGGYGPVYKGKLPDGQEIAAKRLSRSSGQGISEFKNEVQLVAKLQHRNLVRLLGCCFEGQEKILIYEYVINKSLDKFIFGGMSKRQQLDCFTRFKIIQGITKGLMYLHEDSRLKVIHRDLKASNILLDKDMNAKISDFGMAKIFGLDQTQGNTSRIAGTYGYMAPEYAMQGMFSVKSDVFSFGVILIEIISGESNAAFYKLDSGEDLVGYAWKLWKENRAMELVDKMMPGPLQISEIVRCIHVGLLCLQEGATDRPTMSQVGLMLGNASMTLSIPSPPAFVGGRSKIQSESEASNTISTTTQSDSKGNTSQWSGNDVTITELDAR